MKNITPETLTVEISNPRKPCKSKQRSTDEEPKKLLVRSGVTKQERKHIDKREALKETEDRGDKNRKQRGTDNQGNH